jgi:hypothetical protein
VLGGHLLAPAGVWKETDEGRLRSGVLRDERRLDRIDRLNAHESHPLPELEGYVFTGDLSISGGCSTIR